MPLALRRFVDVRFPHPYYRGEVCLDLQVQPTAATAALLAARRLRFLPRPGGFSLAGPVEAPGAGHERARFPLEPGNRLVFALVPTHPDFLYFTDLPQEAARGQRYLLRSREGSRVLSSQEAVGGEDRVRLCAPRFSVKVSHSSIGARAVVEDEAGTVLAHTQVPPFEGEELELPFSLGGFGGLARVRVGGAAPERLFVDAELPALGPFAALELQPLQETWPPPGARGLQAIAFTASFRRRLSHWRYHIVVPEGWKGAEGLSIHYPAQAPFPYPAGITFERASFPEVRELFPERGVVSFESSHALPFSQVALPNVSLKSGQEELLLRHLPNAPCNTLKRAGTVPERLVSDVFVRCEPKEMP